MMGRFSDAGLSSAWMKKEEESEAVTTFFLSQ